VLPIIRSMPGTYSQLLYHVVFSTKRREPWITTDVAERLYPFVGGIVRDERGTLIDINGIEDHVHLLVLLRPDASVSNLMRNVKARSSAWIHATFPRREVFRWQEGYGAFTVSKSGEAAVKDYIERQRDHHRVFDFKAEYLKLLELHGVRCDASHVFD
jgi:putative transposase